MLSFNRPHLFLLSLCAVSGFLPALPHAHLQAASRSNRVPVMTLPDRITTFKADLGSLDRFYTIECSPTRVSRLKNRFLDELGGLSKIDFLKLDQDSQIDYLLLKNHVENRLRRLENEAKADQATALLRPFSDEIIGLEEARQSMKPIDGEKSARTLEKIRKEIGELRVSIEGGLTTSKSIAYRAVRTTEALRGDLEHWFKFYAGYDPIFSWWCEVPYKAANDELYQLGLFIKEKIVGIRAGDKDAIVGDPLGRAALLDELKSELIAYTPEELMAFAEEEFAWCESKMKRASQAMGFGDDWKAALEKVKNDHERPGDQPKLILDLALEAVDYIKKNDLVTVPKLAEETWRMEMMTPEAQKVSPFFLGGEEIRVSFPTDTMEHSAKLMSMRGNNRHFARATVHHELIPGHHLQFFYLSRYRPYRSLFSTPFWIEGWALYWEFLLWDRGFAKSPENEVGMLFWRMHRCARIIFSLKFHMGQMTPQECVDFLVDRVGHERSTAEGEVRRSFGGSYPPLYQAAYMLGAFQIRALREEVVGSGKMTEKQFHDRILMENQMPIEIMRALFTNAKLTPEFEANWKFYRPTK